MANVWWTSAGEMLLWLMFVNTGWRNVAVAKVSWTSTGDMLLWLRFHEC